MSALVLAGELGLPLFVVRMEGLMTRFIGETAAKLRVVFDAIQSTRGVYLFDEFDSIGAKRAYANDVGEVRRVLNSFLHFIETDESDSLLIAATNHPQLLDRALLRRFDDVLEYGLPEQSSVQATLKSKIGHFPCGRLSFKRLAQASAGLSLQFSSRVSELS